MDSVAIQALRPEQSARTSVEIVEMSERASLGMRTTISGQSTDAISLLSQISETAHQAYSKEAIKIPMPIGRWSSPLEKRFAHLAALMASGRASGDEKGEFLKLQNTRRRTHLARSGTEVLRDFEQRERTAALVAALRKYVEPLPAN
jgi:hypothetical protein